MPKKKMSQSKRSTGGATSAAAAHVSPAAVPVAAATVPTLRRGAGIPPAAGPSRQVRIVDFTSDAIRERCLFGQGWKDDGVTYEKAFGLEEPPRVYQTPDGACLIFAETRESDDTLKVHGLIVTPFLSINIFGDPDDPDEFFCLSWGLDPHHPERARLLARAERLMEFAHGISDRERALHYYVSAMRAYPIHMQMTLEEIKVRMQLILYTLNCITKGAYLLASPKDLPASYSLQFVYELILDLHILREIRDENAPLEQDTLEEEECLARAILLQAQIKRWATVPAFTYSTIRSGSGLPKDQLPVGAPGKKVSASQENFFEKRRAALEGRITRENKTLQGLLRDRLSWSMGWTLELAWHNFLPIRGAHLGVTMIKALLTRMNALVALQTSQKKKGSAEELGDIVWALQAVVDKPIFIRRLEKDLAQGLKDALEKIKCLRTKEQVDLGNGTRVALIKKNSFSALSALAGESSDEEGESVSKPPVRTASAVSKAAAASSSLPFLVLQTQKGPVRVSFTGTTPDTLKAVVHSSA